MNAKPETSVPYGESYFVKTSKGKNAFVYQNFLFYNDNPNKQLWRCSRRKTSNCRRTCRIIDDKVVTNGQSHTHEPFSSADFKFLKLVDMAKNKAVDMPNEKPYHTIASSINSSSSIQGLNDHKVQNIRRSMHRKRRSVFKVTPKQRR